MATNESSGRWDATGSFEEAVEEQRTIAQKWAASLTRQQLRHSILAMAEDPNAFTLYQRRALLIDAAYYLGERNYG